MLILEYDTPVLYTNDVCRLIVTFFVQIDTHTRESNHTSIVIKTVRYIYTPSK